MATATKAKPIELTAEQRKFLGSQRGGWCTIPKGDIPDGEVFPSYVRQLVHDGYLHYDGIWADAHHWCLTGKGRAALKGGRSEGDLRTGRRRAKLSGSTPGSRSVGRERTKPDTSTYEGRFAARLGALVKKRDIDPRDLAVTLGVDKSVVYDWLAGRKMPSIGRFPELAKALGVKKPGDLLPTE